MDNAFIYLKGCAKIVKSEGKYKIEKTDWKLQGARRVGWGMGVGGGTPGVTRNFREFSGKSTGSNVMDPVTIQTLKHMYIPTAKW